MKIKVAGRLVAISAAVFGAALISTPAAAQKIENSYICVFKKDAVAKSAVSRKASELARGNGGQVKLTYNDTIRGFSATISAQGAARIAANNPNIAFCEQDQVVTTVQKGKPGGGGGTAPAQVTPWGITRVGGGTTTAAGRAIVIDSGVQADHPDLNVNAALGANFSSDSSSDDFSGHGTHVAGTIAAINNSIGVVGVAPGTEIVAVKVLNRRGSGTISGVIAGVDYAASIAQNGDVANMSLGGGFSQALNDAVVAAASTGLKFTLAAGNESTSATTKSPASANGPNIYTISSFANGDVWSSFSNFGNPPVDFAEPGSSIYSTYKGGGYATLSGTSMAAPHAAGLLLLGSIRSGGTVSGDPDGNADTIGIR
ncbi:S8 family serine peptidase [Erythrobacter sp. SDW2]|uniref:S8 family serine peptidase n=1 Tax=Erythrobacter sp. SDW2 TaxID=2907154 RepID=UPI001F21BDCD|nr:S8 family serine peptidase [Erythrobacter sp. SDW2]UIP06378.1 S8 family serine peptidase [Erythrobacter sp. SDW2]